MFEKTSNFHRMKLLEFRNAQLNSQIDTGVHVRFPALDCDINAISAH